MTSSNGNIFRLTGPLWGNPTVTGGFPSQRSPTQSFSLIFAWTNRWANTRDAGDLRRKGAHYDVTVMYGPPISIVLCRYNFLFMAKIQRWFGKYMRLKESYMDPSSIRGTFIINPDGYLWYHSREKSINCLDYVADIWTSQERCSHTNTRMW